MPGERDLPPLDGDLETEVEPVVLARRGLLGDADLRRRIEFPVGVAGAGDLHLDVVHRGELVQHVLGEQGGVGAAEQLGEVGRDQRPQGHRGGDHLVLVGKVAVGALALVHRQAPVRVEVVPGPAQRQPVAGGVGGGEGGGWGRRAAGSSTLPSRLEMVVSVRSCGYATSRKVWRSSAGITSGSRRCSRVRRARGPRGAQRREPCGQQVVVGGLDVEHPGASQEPAARGLFSGDGEVGPDVQLSGGLLDLEVLELGVRRPPPGRWRPARCRAGTPTPAVRACSSDCHSSGEVMEFSQRWSIAPLE